MAETPDLDGAFPRLSEAQLESLAADGERRPTTAGEVVYRAGDPDCDFFVVLSGRVALVEDYGGPNERQVGVHGPGRFLGGLGLFTGRPVFLTAVVREPGEVLVSRPRGCASAREGPDARRRDPAGVPAPRELLIGLGVGVRIVGSRFDPDTRRLREFAARNRLPHQWIDLEKDPDAEDLLRQLNVTAAETPLVLWQGTVLRNPTNAELARAVGLPARHARGGDRPRRRRRRPGRPRRRRLRRVGGAVTVALDAVASGGQAGRSSRIENYLGFPSGISGTGLAERSRIQAGKFGVRIAVPSEASSLQPPQRTITSWGLTTAAR